MSERYMKERLIEADRSCADTPNFPKIDGLRFKRHFYTTFIFLDTFIYSAGFNKKYILCCTIKYVQEGELICWEEFPWGQVKGAEPRPGSSSTLKTHSGDSPSFYRLVNEQRNMKHD